MSRGFHSLCSFFILTEDLSAKMVLTDAWTIFMGLFALTGIILAGLTRNRKANEDKENA